MARSVSSASASRASSAAMRTSLSEISADNSSLCNIMEHPLSTQCQQAEPGAHLRFLGKVADQPHDFPRGLFDQRRNRNYLIVGRTLRLLIHIHDLQIISPGELGVTDPLD